MVVSLVQFYWPPSSSAISRPSLNDLALTCFRDLVHCTSGLSLVICMKIFCYVTSYDQATMPPFLLRKARNLSISIFLEASICLHAWIWLSLVHQVYQEISLEVKDVVTALVRSLIEHFIHLSETLINSFSLKQNGVKRMAKSTEHCWRMSMTCKLKLSLPNRLLCQGLSDR